MNMYVEQVEEEFKNIWMQYQPKLHDPMGYTEVLRELEDTLIKRATTIWPKEPRQTKCQMGLGKDAHLLTTMNRQRRQTYTEFNE